MAAGSTTTRSVATLVDEDGRVLGFEKGSPLLEGGGSRDARWRLSSLGRDVIILSRVPEVPDPRAPAVTTPVPGVAMSGEISALNGVADIIEIIHQNRWTGTLHILHDGSQRAIEFTDGDVATARSNHPRDRLGELLYDHGLISREDLEHTLADMGAENRIGEALVARGLVSPEEAAKFLEKQVEEIFAGVLELRQGTYCFERRGTGDIIVGDTRQAIPTRQLLLDTARRIDELRAFRAEIPSAAVSMVRRVPHPDTAKLDDELRRLLVLVDGRKTVKDMARETRLGEIETTRRLYQLVRLGFIEVVGAKPSVRSRLAISNNPAAVLSVLTDVLARIDGSYPSAQRTQEIRRHLEALLYLEGFTEEPGASNESKKETTLTADIDAAFGPGL